MLMLIRSLLHAVLWGQCMLTYKSKNNELRGNFIFQFLFVTQLWLKKMRLSLRLAFIHWCNIVGKQFSTKNDIATVQWRMGLTRCRVFLPGRGLNSPAPQSFQWSAPFPISPPAERYKTELLKISSDSRPKHHFNDPFRWPSGQIRNQWVCVVGLAAHCVTLFPRVIIFWVTSKHLVESFQGYKLTENYFLLLIPAWSSKYSKQPVLLETGQESCNFWAVTEKVGTQAFKKLTCDLLSVIAWLDTASVTHKVASFGQGQIGHALYTSSKKRRWLYPTFYSL